MNFEVRAVSGEDYDAYLEARESGLDTFEALEEIGQPGLSSATTPFESLQNKNIDQQQSAGG
jgi:cytochrome c oxidase subunit 2